jgi:hypothetical protein
MSSNIDAKIGRRGFLKSVAAATGAVPLAPRLPVAVGVTGVAAVARSGTAQAADGPGVSKLPAPDGGYQSLSPDEAGFVEALVNVMCPADGLTPSGTDCGLATFIDRQLAGGFGKGERLYMRGPWKQGKPQHGYQLPLTPEQFFKAGVAVANEASCRPAARRRRCFPARSCRRQSERRARTARFLVQRTRLSAVRPGLLRRSNLRRQRRQGVLEDDRLSRSARDTRSGHGRISGQAISGRAGSKIDRRLQLRNLSWPKD